jgi:FtsP/CotA-like multicopper oxidase with cupredoxin domain
VQLRQPGLYRVVSRGLTKVQFFCTGPDDAVLATINVAGAGLKPVPVAQLSVAGPKAPIRSEEIVTTRMVTMSMAANRGRVPFPQFKQNGQPYNESFVTFRVKGGTAEEWILANPDRTMHPFHVHVNPFQVKEISSSHLADDPAMKEVLRLDPSRENWRDTVIVPPMGFVKIWIRWSSRHPGKTICHCHFLAHEDTGMAMNILIE